MYKIEKKDYGFMLTFADDISENEMLKWVEESKSTLTSTSSKFGVFVDMRTLKPLSSEAKAAMEKGQKLYKESGMERSVVILNNPVILLQFKKIAKESGIYQWERYLDASSDSMWENKALQWIKNNIDPDK